jgi:hypothetical protein
LNRFNTGGDWYKTALQCINGGVFGQGVNVITYVPFKGFSLKCAQNKLPREFRQSKPIKTLIGTLQHTPGGTGLF